MTIRALIVDDEPIARRSVRRMLKVCSGVEVIGECGDGESAISQILESQPDIVFLDVQMPEVDGIEVVRRVGVSAMPVTIFITAYDQYALRAFDSYAIDYLLKPLSKVRFQEAMRRARDHIEGRLARSELKNGIGRLDTLASQRQYADRLPLQISGRIVFVAVKEIDFIEAEGNYVTLHVGKQQFVVRDSLTNFAIKLNPTGFLRIHRSTIVNLSRVKSVQPWFRGHHVVVLQDGRELRMSRYQVHGAQLLGISQP
ncbi:MAG TPA: LytTR family DNA-binding domain-containing protein [Pirellulales bacterium]